MNEGIAWKIPLSKKQLHTLKKHLDEIEERRRIENRIVLEKIREYCFSRCGYDKEKSK